MRPDPDEVLYVEVPTIPDGITLDAYRQGRSRPANRGAAQPRRPGTEWSRLQRLLGRPRSR